MLFSLKGYPTPQGLGDRVERDSLFICFFFFPFPISLAYDNRVNICGMDSISQYLLFQQMYEKMPITTTVGCLLTSVQNGYQEKKVKFGDCEERKFLYIVSQNINQYSIMENSLEISLKKKKLDLLYPTSGYKPK